MGSEFQRKQRQFREDMAFHEQSRRWALSYQETKKANQTENEAALKAYRDELREQYTGRMLDAIEEVFATWQKHQWKRCALHAHVDIERALENALKSSRDELRNKLSKKKLKAVEPIFATWEEQGWVNCAVHAQTDVEIALKNATRKKVDGKAL